MTARMKLQRVITSVAFGFFIGTGCGGKEDAPAEGTKKVVDDDKPTPKADEPVKKPRKVDLVGSYTLTGETATGTAITGTVEVKPLKGDAYLIVRTQDGKKLGGVMYREGEHVFTAWSDKGAGLRTFTVNDDGSLDGTYFGNTYPKLSKEALVGGSAKLTGVYRIVNAAYADGSAYSGTVSISLKNDIYQCSYQISDNTGRDSFMAYGLRSGNVLGIASHAGGPFGFAHYKIEADGSLSGENGWSDDAADGPGKETLKK
jgi:hypothetical protein